MDLSIVIVNWNVRELLRRCLSSVYRATGDSLELEVIVVDNASSDGSVAMVREDFPQVHLIANEENLGFTRGNNQAIAQSRGRYVLLLNP
nr:glycosyltransferase [Anaerolineae bacterium]